MKKTLVALTLSSFILGGCAANSSNTQKGAGIGAVVGALIGKGTGDHDKSRYVWGAALGALAGSAIGSYMDKQEEELREELSDTGVEVYRDGDTIRLYIPGNITFATGESRIVSGFYPVLDDVAKVLKNYEKTRLSITGHTDNVGEAAYNQQLSVNRANSVADYLAQSGVNPARLQTQGFGESQPIASNQTVEGRQQNRRVELSILPIRG
ncbi:OmpA family protein [Aestuariibacter halophilus]|uniref:OmpA family protein n=1 Tax=Fluctibacter halophilus TaxID=226011 RepID=A0ABS8G4Z7_9ALTE|nr:OmpA family protein [Aestuariibacter halophilus]MCC2615186.1 OmpA family protein [Aestuariibacter halophilus]